MEIIEKDVKNLVDDLNKEKISFNQKSILVTGGGGFLGSWICDVLVRQNAKVICVDNFASGQKDNIENLIGLKNFEFVEHDISKPIFFDENIDIIMHLASRASPFEFSRYPIQILKANTLGTWIALGVAKEKKARLVYASTSEIYGDPDERYVPTAETYNGNVNPVGPRSCYDEAKRAGEAFVTAYNVQHGLDSRIIRIFNTYGPRMRPGDLYGRVVPRFIEQAINGIPLTVFGDGTQTRSFTYVTDLVKGILKTAYLPSAKGKVINLGSNVETKIIELAKNIIELTTSKSKIVYLPLPEDDPKRRCPNISVAKSVINWQPVSTLKDGLLKTIKWFNKKY